MHNRRRWAAILLGGALTLLPALWTLAPQPAYGGPAADMQKDVLQVVQEVLPAVVSIKYLIKKKIMPAQGRYGEDFIDSAGSGFIFLPKGFILTNAHVLAENKPGKQKLKNLGPDNIDEKITVIFYGGKQLPARFVFADIDQDVACIKVEGQKFPTVRLGDSDQLRPGQWAIAIGNPWQYHESVTLGVISATERRMQSLDFIQTSAPIFPGNSGGPLLDIEGRVIGINSSVAKRTAPITDSAGNIIMFAGRPLYVDILAQVMGFAIPIRRALEVLRPHLKGEPGS